MSEQGWSGTWEQFEQGTSLWTFSHSRGTWVQQPDSVFSGLTPKSQEVVLSRLSSSEKEAFRHSDEVEWRVPLKRIRIINLGG